MTAFDVDRAELGVAVDRLGGCQRDLLALAADIDAAQRSIAGDWSGQASTAQSAAYDSWRDDCAAMVAALAALRGVALDADSHYAGAVATNQEMWSQVAP